MTTTLAQWLAKIEAGHPSEIDLGLERVSAVATRLGLDLSHSTIITVAGTNGKGSTSTLLDSILRTAGYTTGVYTSPHFIRYNERIQVNGDLASDQQICDAFAAIDQARADISLTYFEFGTLAALLIFQAAQPDYLILEVGLGGRLDAVNIVDADVAVLTSVALDHVDWLGSSLDSIGREKAGIFRAGRPAVCGIAQPPASVTRRAAEIGASLYLRDADFRLLESDQHWSWSGTALDGQAITLDNLPRPQLPLPNAATVLQVLALCAPQLSAAQIAEGLQRAQMVGRMQSVQAGGLNLLLDVAHNPEAAEYLAKRVAERSVTGTIHLVLGMLADKDREAVMRALAPVVGHWHLVSLQGPRASSAEQLELLLGPAYNVNLYNNVAAALQHLSQQATSDDLVLVCGSFLTVTEALQWLSQQA